MQLEIIQTYKHLPRLETEEAHHLSVIFFPGSQLTPCPVQWAHQVPAWPKGCKKAGKGSPSLDGQLLLQNIDDAILASPHVRAAFDETNINEES